MKKVTVTQEEVMNEIKVILKDYTDTTYTDNTFHFNSFSMSGDVEVIVDEEYIGLDGYHFNREIEVNVTWKNELIKLMSEYIEFEDESLNEMS